MRKPFHSRKSILQTRNARNIALSRTVFQNQKYILFARRVWRNVPTRLNVARVHDDVFVAVAAALLVPEAKHVQELVHYDAFLLASVPDGHIRPSLRVSNRRVAAETIP